MSESGIYKSQIMTFKFSPRSEREIVLRHHMRHVARSRRLYNVFFFNIKADKNNL